MNAKSRYKENLKEIEKNITLLRVKLKRHKCGFRENETNWGYVGDLSYINKELEEINKFFVVQSP